jgi:hypothetical protein
MVPDRRARSRDAAFADRLPPARSALLILIPVLLVGLVSFGGVAARSVRPPSPPTPVTLAGGAQVVTTTELTDSAAEVLTRALTDGAGIEFEIVQTSTITARPDGPPVEIPDPTDRSATLGSAPRYVMGTLIERGLATPDGYWMELLHGPEPGAETDFDVAKAQVSRQALVRDGTRYRNDGQGWHETDRLPGIGLDPVTLAELPRLIEAAAAGTDVALTEASPIDPEVGRTAPLGPETVAIDPARVAVTIAGLKGPQAPPVRAVATQTSATSLPGIIAVDLGDATEPFGRCRSYLKLNYSFMHYSFI